MHRMASSTSLQSASWSTLATSMLGAPFTGPGYAGGDSATPDIKNVEIRDTADIPALPKRFIRIRVVEK
jgi:hypothetical protein